MQNENSNTQRKGNFFSRSLSFNFLFFFFPFSDEIIKVRIKTSCKVKQCLIRVYIECHDIKT